MAQSTCPKCTGTAFELKDADRNLSGTDYAYSFIQCRSCGAVVGVVEGFFLPVLLNKIAAKLGLKLL